MRINEASARFSNLVKPWQQGDDSSFSSPSRYIFTGVARNGIVFS